MEPGKEEQKLRNRLHFKLLGFWPQSVVDERLGRFNAKYPPSENVKAIMRNVYETAGKPIPPQYL